MVNPDSNITNAQVQEFLTAWAQQHLKEGDPDWGPIEGTIELIQETFSPTGHEAERREQRERDERLAEAASMVPDEVQHMIVLQALDGLLENAIEDAHIGGLEDRAADIAALQHVREHYTVAYGVEE